MAHGVEADRLEAARAGVPWRRWGPYLSERQWGTVREDYSDNGDAWSYFTHDQARSRTYKWGEDGIAGLCDDHQRLCFGIAVWNGADPILKERMFGLTNAEGNHGEDVKEYYFYLDATPTSSYLKYRYRYPLAAYPYEDLVATNRARNRLDFEYELIDTGVFDDNRFVDVDVEYAKRDPDDIEIRITVANRSRDAATDPPAAVAVVPQHVVDGRRERLVARRRRRRECRDRRRPRRPRSAGVALRGRTAAAVHRERVEHRAVVGNCERDAVREGRLSRVRRQRPGRGGQPGPHRYQGGSLVRAGDPRRGLPCRPTALVPGQCRPGRRRRTAVRRPHRRGRPVLRLDHAVDDDCRRGRRDAPGTGVDAVEQAALLLRPRPLARGASCAPAARRGRQRAQPQLVPHGQRRHHLDAGHVGVPVVRLVGSRLPHRGAGDGRPRLRQVAARVDAARAVSPPQRPAPRLRVELLRRQPAGARLGDPARLRVGGGTARRGRRRLVEARLPEAADQLHVVGQPQGPDGAQRVRRRVPRPRQHRRVRSQLSVAHWWTARAVGWHGVDGVLLPSDARHRPRTVPARPDVRGHGAQVRRALHLHRRGDGPHRRQPRRAVGRGGRVLLRRAPPSRRAGVAAQGALDGRAAAARARRW